jgi:hypothetical protein
VPAGTIAQPHPHGNAVEIDLSEIRTALNPGTNILAIQAHRAYGVYGTFMLNPELLANFTRGPLVQNVSSNQAYIVWRTPVPADSAVEFGLDGGLDRVQADTNLVLNHTVGLSDLKPGATYRYRVVSSGNGRRAASPEYSFRTFSTGGTADFLVVGDTGHGGLPQQRIAGVMAGQKADLVLHVGDVIYPQYAAGQMDQKCYSIYRTQMRSTPFFYAIGNHEYYGGGAAFLADILQPSNNPIQTKAYYSFDHGDVHFVALDTVVPYGNGFTPDTVQYQWLEKDLAASEKPWKILFFHTTIRSSGPHYGDDYSGNGVPDRLELQNTIGKLASRYGVQMFFTGHDHLYERSHPVNGVVTVVSGGGGAMLYQFGGQWDEASNQFWSRYNCVKVSIRDGTLRLSALGLDGEVFDEMTLQKDPPPRQVYPSAWHSPTIDARPGNDASGNIPGQKFEFTGTPALSKIGKNSSLGRLWVNNDGNDLFVGLDQLMVYSNQNILLFIQPGDARGRTRMAGWEGGLVTPSDAGAEALATVKNLAFTGFEPTIGCILGDAHADGQYRAFRRTNGFFQGGQGVFFLEPGFPPVEGVRLQQFNRSPQQSALMPDASASLVMFAIPLSSLPGLAQNPSIRIGAVVAGEPLSTNILAASLDDGFLGAAMSAGADATPFLECLEFRLAPNPRPVLASLRLVITPPSQGILRLQWQAEPGMTYSLDYFDPGMKEFMPFPGPFRPATNAAGAYELDWPQTPASAMRLFRLRATP